MKIVYKLILIISLLFGSFNSQAQVDSSAVNNNPYTAIYNHLYYLQSDSYDPDRAALSLPQEIFDKIDLTIQLKQVIDGKGLFLDLNRLPRDHHYIDTLTKESIFFIGKNDPLLYVEKVGKRWQYSRTTLKAIPEMHKKLFPIGTDLMTYFHGPKWQFKLLGLNVWKLAAFGIVLFIFWILYAAINIFSKFLSSRFLRSRVNMNKEVNQSILKFSRLFGLICGVRFLLYLVPMFQFAPRLTSMMIKGLSVLSLFFIVLVVKQFVHILFDYLSGLSKKTANTLDDHLLPILEKLVMIVIWAFGIIYMLDYMDVNVTALLAGISIGGLALALAAQDTVKNFFGSIMIFLDKPFQIGDRVHFKGVDGKVEEVGIRATRIRTFGDSITYVPNALIADSVIDNKGLRVYRRFRTEFGITYDTPPAKIEKFVEGIREIIKLHPGTKKESYEVHMTGFNESSISILMYTFFTVPNWTEELKAKHEILSAVLKLAEKLAVDFAFPTQNLHIKEVPAQNTWVKSKNKETNRLNEDLKAALADINLYFKKKDRLPKAVGQEGED